MMDFHLSLHGLAILRASEPDQVAGLIGLDPDVVTANLDNAAESGRTVKSGDRYMLTPPAEMALRAEYSRFYNDLRKTDDMITAYDQFEKINSELKSLITDWQTMEVGGERVANDHSNREYDEDIIDRLGDVHERFEPILARMAKHVPRLSIYSDLLLEALEKAEDGDIDWVSDAKIQSYHTVWFEMHEDLLRILGRQREED